MSQIRKVLVTRNDRLGDVLLALPTLDYIQKQSPKTEIHFLCKSEYLETLRPFLEAKSIKGIAIDRPDVSELKSRFIAERYDGALILFPDRPILFAAWAAKIPVRTGMISKPWSLLTLNAGIRQHRSRAECNEAEYNLQLAAHFLKKLGFEVTAAKPGSLVLPKVQVPAAEAESLLQRLGFSGAFVVVHPGMGGSALNLRPGQYLSIIEAVEKDLALPVLVSVGPSPKDNEMISELRKARPSLKIAQDVKLSTLLELFRRAKAVIGPSTGPLHLAHFAGTPTLGIYSPVQTHHARRWQPWGGSGKGFVSYPEVDCPGTQDCVGTRCPKFLCMDHHPWAEQIVRQLQSL